MTSKESGWPRWQRAGPTQPLSPTAAAADHVPGLLDTAGLIGLECSDAGVLDNLATHGEHIPGMDELPERGAWRLAEYGAQAQDDANDLVETARKQAGDGRPRLFEDEQGQSEVWEVRRSTIEYTRIPGEHPTVGELAGDLLLRPHSTVELVDRAEAAGLVERTPDKDDGRLVRVRLTREGDRVLQRLTPAHLDRLHELAVVLDELVTRHCLVRRLRARHQRHRELIPTWPLR